ncbi:hypothetical protein DFJ73DRAFT_43674 [Zopfochytrium polystomum]|nr:hypothetical protein DFJ73DRAFT_43674 [Zopfochytrium polystomum]
MNKRIRSTEKSQGEGNCQSKLVKWGCRNLRVFESMFAAFPALCSEVVFSCQINNPVESGEKDTTTFSRSINISSSLFSCFYRPSRINNHSRHVIMPRLRRKHSFEKNWNGSFIVSQVHGGVRVRMRIKGEAQALTSSSSCSLASFFVAVDAAVSFDNIAFRAGRFWIDSFAIFGAGALGGLLRLTHGRFGDRMAGRVETGNLDWTSLIGSV